MTIFLLFDAPIYSGDKPDHLEVKHGDKKKADKKKKK
jgi:hypothetical protein